MSNNNINDMRNKVILGEYGVSHPQSSDFPGSYYGYDDSWNFEKFKNDFKIEIKRKSEDGNEMEFDMIGIDCAIANAFRRILLSEIPTVAIDRVVIHNNTSLIQDEVLAHRFGLIPIKADADILQYREENETAPPNEHDSLKFTLKIKCKKKPDATNDMTDPEHLYNNSNVISGDLKWKPLGAQSIALKNHDIRPVNDDILIAKLRPGQEIDVELFCFKNIGKTHAKFSPVATATYRLLPEVRLLKPIVGELAVKLKNCFAPGVIEINKKGEAYVLNARYDNCSREVYRHEDLKNDVELTRIRNHFIFTIESTGCIPCSTLVERSIKILMNKCKKFIDILDNIENDD